MTSTKTFEYDVRVIAASKTEWGKRIATIVARYPRFIHAELMTHKDLSRNASSSRAIPFKKMLKITRENMAAPIFWGKNQPGMQAQEELTGFAKWAAIFLWHLTGHIVLSLAWVMSFTQVHKQIINRMIEPWTYINVQITATNWERMLKLRVHEAAQPEFCELGRAIRFAVNTAQYTTLREGEWHLPWVSFAEQKSMPLQNAKLVSAARSARLSYTPIGEVNMNVRKDLSLATGLLEQFHLSPFEHQATPKKGKHANLDDWRNFRTELDH
jgi:hypothetical protein